MAIERPLVWLDEEERLLMVGAASLLGASVFHLIHDSESRTMGMVHTFEDRDELVDALRNCIERIENGEHEKVRQEVML